MVGKDSNYRVVDRGDDIAHFRVGGQAFFQRHKEHGGGFWFSRTYPHCYWLEFERPTSLSVGIRYLLWLERVDDSAGGFDDDFRL